MLSTLVLTPSFSSPILEENAVGVRNDTLVLTPSFSSPILEENAVGLRNDTFTCTATSSQLLNQNIPKSINLNPSATLLSKQFCDSSRH